MKLAKEIRKPNESWIDARKRASEMMKNQKTKVSAKVDTEIKKLLAVVKKRKDLKVGLHEGESYWNNYEVDLPQWEKPQNMFTAQYHASYQSSIDNKHPLLVNFLKACVGK
jgi:hypothetical protein